MNLNGIGFQLEELVQTNLTQTEQRLVGERRQTLAPAALVGVTRFLAGTPELPSQ